MTEGEGRRYDAFEEMYEKEYDGIRRYMGRMILNDQGAAKDEQRGVVYHIESGDNIEPVIYRTDYISEILPELTADRDNERL